MRYSIQIRLAMLALSIGIQPSAIRTMDARAFAGLRAIKQSRGVS